MDLREQIFERVEGNSDPYHDELRRDLTEEVTSIVSAFDKLKEIASQGKNALRSAKDTYAARRFHQNERAVRLQKLIDPTINEIYVIAQPKESYPVVGLISVIPGKYEYLEGKNGLANTITKLFKRDYLDMTRENVTEAAELIFTYKTTDLSRFFQQSGIDFADGEEGKQRVSDLVQYLEGVEPDKVTPIGVATAGGNEYGIWMLPDGKFQSVTMSEAEEEEQIESLQESRQLDGRNFVAQMITEGREQRNKQYFHESTNLHKGAVSRVLEETVNLSGVSKGEDEQLEEFIDDMLSGQNQRQMNELYDRVSCDHDLRGINDLRMKLGRIQKRLI